MATFSIFENNKRWVKSVILLLYLVWWCRSSTCVVGIIVWNAYTTIATRQRSIAKVSSNTQQLITITFKPGHHNWCCCWRKILRRLPSLLTTQQQQQSNNQPPSMEFSTCKSIINDCREVLSNNAMCEVSSLLLLHVFVHLNGRIFT